MLQICEPESELAEQSNSGWRFNFSIMTLDRTCFDMKIGQVYLVFQCRLELFSFWVFNR